jgi:Fe2+ transport system protein B
VKPHEIDKIKSLDPTGCNGTVQSVLMNPNINQAHYAEVLYYLLSKVLEEKGYLERASNAMTRVLQANGLVDELNKCLELEEKL